MILGKPKQLLVNDSVLKQFKFYKDRATAASQLVQAVYSQDYPTQMLGNMSHTDGSSFEVTQTVTPPLPISAFKLDNQGATSIKMDYFAAN